MSKYNLYLLQPQYSATIGGKKQYWIPYSVGCIWSYAQQFDDVISNFELVDLIFRRETFESLNKRFINSPPDICGFSVYAWNEQYCLLVAKQIKEAYPECKIVFGGPQCDTGMVKRNPFIDSIVLAEGEETFVKILRSVRDGEPLKEIYDKDRLENLEIPSPYLTGVFDKIIKDNPTFVWSTVIESNRGCPYQCTFCDWGSLTYSKVRKFDMTRIRAEFDWIRNNPIVFITSADANFGMYKERDLEIAKLIREASDHGNIESVALTFAKNSYSDIFNIAKVIGNLSRGVTVSVQSMTPETLTEIKRKNMKVNDISEMMRLSEIHQVPAYTELILGLPLETAESWRASLADLLELGQHHQIDINFCNVLRNSELGSTFSRRLYRYETVVAHDYSSFLEIADDEVSCSEEQEIVRSTSTMTAEEMVESYLYGAMIINLHTTGYTQYYARYGRALHNVSYRNFYDRLFAILNEDPIISTHMSTLRGYVTEFLSTGDIKSSSIKSGHLNSYSFPVIYSMRNEVFNAGKQCFEELSGATAPEWLNVFQRHAVFDDEQHREIAHITVPYDLTSWEKKDTEYTISMSAARKAGRNRVQTFTTRNSTFYKNVIVKVNPSE